MGKKRTTAAFLLLEVLVTVVILSFGIVFTMRAFRNVFLVDRRSAQFFSAGLAAEDMALRLRTGFSHTGDFPLSGNVAGAEDLTYAAEKIDLTLNDKMALNNEEAQILLPDNKYYLLKVSVKNNAAEVLNYPLVIRKTTGSDEI